MIQRQPLQLVPYDPKDTQLVPHEESELDYGDCPTFCSIEGHRHSYGNYTLFPFQEEGVQFMLERQHTLLFDEMGLGKTIEIIEYALRKDAQRILVIAPKTLLTNWRNEIHNVSCPDSKVTLYRRGATYGSGPWDIQKPLPPIVLEPHTLKQCPVSCLRNVEEWMQKRFPRWFIVNTEWVRKEENAKLLSAIAWDLVVIDEGHRFRNPYAQQTQGLLKLPNREKTSFIIATGSPVVNRPTDIWSLLTRVEAIDEPFTVFANKYCHIDMVRGRPKFRGIRISSKAALQEILSNYMIQRKKKDVLHQLPDKIHKTVMLDLENDAPRQWLLYETMEEFGLAELEDEGVSAGGVLALLIRLRQIAIDPRLVGIFKLGRGLKTDQILDTLEEANEKIIIASTFTSYFGILEGDLREEGWKPFWQKRYDDPPDQKYYVRITGKEKGESRAANVESFQNDPRVMACLLSTHIAEGITLTASSHMIFVDLWWNDAVNSQTEDRIHRIGQKNAALIERLTALDTVDLAIQQTVQFKKAAAAGTLGDDEGEDTARMTYDFLVTMRATRQAARAERKAKMRKEYIESQAIISDHEKQAAKEGATVIEGTFRDLD